MRLLDGSCPTIHNAHESRRFCSTMTSDTQSKKDHQMKPCNAGKASEDRHSNF